MKSRKDKDMRGSGRGGAALEDKGASAGKLTLSTLARQAGVSLSTASRVLNRSAWVDPKLEKRVREAAARLGMPLEPRKRARMVAFLLSNRQMLHPFHSAVMCGAQTSFAERGYHMLFFPLSYTPGVPPSQLALTSLLERRGLVDGFIVAGVNSLNLLELLADSGVPFAVLGNTVLGEWKAADYPAVWVDDINGALETTRHLIALGHEQAWFVGNVRLSWHARRLQGYRAAMEAAGLQPLLQTVDSQDDHEIGYLGAKLILSSEKPVSALVCATDTIANGAYEVLRENNLRVGTDLSVTGFNDTPEAAILHPALTTVQVFAQQVGSSLASLVLRQIDAGERICQHLMIPTKLVKRESCAAPPSTIRHREPNFETASTGA
jgi:LacI family transcriptional regulator